MKKAKYREEVKLALELNKMVHNECKDVPHDIGLRLLGVVKKHLGEQLNIPVVMFPFCKINAHRCWTARYHGFRKCKEINCTYLQNET